MLSKTWLTENHIDFEYKKYVLLGYLQEVKAHFGLNLLYPDFAELMMHYHDLTNLKENSAQLKSMFPQNMKSLDMEKLSIQYESIIKDDDMMQEMYAIIDFSLPQLAHYLQEGKKIYDFIESHLKIKPIGIIPLNKDFGYLFVNNSQNSTFVYEYTITIFQQADVKYRGINCTFLESYNQAICTTYDKIKSDLIKNRSQLPNPATFAIESDLTFPLDETLLPIAKRLLVRHVAVAA